MGSLLSASKLVADISAARGARDGGNGAACASSNSASKNAACDSPEDRGAVVVAVGAVGINAIAVLVIILIVAIAVGSIGRARREGEAHSGGGDKAQKRVGLSIHGDLLGMVETRM